MKTQTSERLQDIFRAVFGLPESMDVVNLDQSNSPRWDSLDHVSLVAAIESAAHRSVAKSDEAIPTTDVAAPVWDEVPSLVDAV